MKNYIYILKLNQEFRNDDQWSDDTFKSVSNHFNYLSKLKEEKVVILVGKTDYGNDNDDNFGLVIFRAENFENAKKIMNNDPAIINDVMYGEVHPFGIALK